MSRTIRRKNYEETRNSSWHRAGKKVNGIYTYEDRQWSFMGIYESIICGEVYEFKKFSRMDVYRPMTKEERIDHDKRIYRDRKRYGVPHWYVNLYFEQPLRQYNKRELQKYSRNEDYEPMCLARSRDAMWDWT